jgi:UDPglucose--hexose-1-phosphate uridylyltransferase
MSDGRRITYYTASPARVPRPPRLVPAAGTVGSPDHPVVRDGPSSRATPSPSPSAIAERRLDPISEEWVTLATHRQDRTLLPSREECPLCPTRPPAGPTEIGRPSYEVVVFDNRFPSLVAEPPTPALAGGDLYRVEPSQGRCEVVVYSDRHDATLTDLGEERIRLLVDVWADRYAALGADPGVRYVMPFENRGDAIGVTLHHPHGQVYAYPDVPPRPLRHLVAAWRYRRRTGRHVWADVVDDVRRDRQRLVLEGTDFIAQVPFASRFPYELQVVARSHVPSLLELGPAGRDDLARLLHLVVRTYDGLFGFPLPYVMALHSRPTGGAAPGGDWDDISWVWVEFLPPHRDAAKRKYLAGSELAAGAFTVDVAPEAAAARLRRVLTP